MKKSKSITQALFLGFALMGQHLFGQKLEPGSLAPSFKAMDAKGQIVDLEALKGQKVLLSFFRYVSCPVCNFRVHQLLNSHDAIAAKGYTIVAVFESDNTTLQQYLADTSLPFAVVGDPYLLLYKKYGVQKSLWRMMLSVFKGETIKAALNGRRLIANKKIKRDGSLTRLPADFLIDEKGVLKVVYYGKNIGDHLPLSLVIE